MKKSKKKSSKLGYLFIAPFLIMFIFFFIIPLIMGVVMSFTEYGLQDTSATWVGLDNYKTILFDEESVVHESFVNGMIHSTLFVVLFVPIIYILSLLLALMVYHLPKKVQGVYRTIYFLPFAISVSAMAAIWKFAFNTQSGVVNQIIVHFGGEPVSWLAEQPTAWLVVILATLWWTIGFNMIIFLNALNNVNEEMYEAASIDGCTGVKRFFKITLPSIKSATIFVIITQTIASFNLYGQVKLITNGGPNEGTETVLMAIIEEGFNNRNMGMAAAMAILLAIVIIGISIVQYIISRRLDA